jgi:hypothetical protein
VIGPILLIAFGGVLVGGAWSLYQQKASKVIIGATALAAAMAITAGILWQV